MHLNCHTGYARLAFKYFHKHKKNYKYELENTGVILLIQSIICNYL